MAEKVRLQIKTTSDPEAWVDVGAGAAGDPIPVSIESGTLAVSGPVTDAQLRATAVPVSGTVTANAGTNLNTSALALEAGGNLASIKAKTDNIPAQGQALAAASTPVVLTAAQVTTLTPPAAITGFATSAKQDTADTSINTLLKPASTLTAVTTVTNLSQQGGVAIALNTGTRSTGTQRVTIATDDLVPVTGTITAVTAITNALPAGTNAIGKLAANSGVDIGDVDVTSIISGTGATNLGKAEDAAHTSGDVGVFALGVRNDTLATGSGTTGNYTQFSTDLKGRVMVGSAPRDLKGDQTTTITASTTETTIVTAIASTFIDIYGVILANTGSTATSVTIRDVTAGTSKGQLSVPAGDVRGFMLPIDAAWKQTTVNTAWTAQCSASTSSLVVTVFYIKNV